MSSSSSTKRSAALMSIGDGFAHEFDQILAVGAGRGVDDHVLGIARHGLQAAFVAGHAHDRRVVGRALLEPGQCGGLRVEIGQRRGMAFGRKVGRQARGDGAFAATALRVDDENVSHGVSAKLLLFV
jgi:hypothetical protein